MSSIVGFAVCFKVILLVCVCVLSRYLFLEAVFIIKVIGSHLCIGPNCFRCVSADLFKYINNHSLTKLVN